MAELEWIQPDLLNQIIAEAEEHPSRIKYLNNMRRGNKYYSASDEWYAPLGAYEDEDIAENMPASRENLIYDTVNEVGSLLFKNDPIVRLHPIGRPELAWVSDELDKAILAAWRAANTRHVLRSMEKEACIGGLSVGKVGWTTRNKVKYPDGEVMLVKLTPGDVYLDPCAKNAQRGADARYIFHRTWQTPEALLYRYGKTAADALKMELPKGRPPKSFSSFMARIRGKMEGWTRRRDSSDQITDRRVPVYEFWLFPVTDVESQLVIGEMVDEKDYPYGIVATMANDTILKKRANPFIKKRRVALGEGLDVQGLTATVGHRSHPFVLLYWSREMDEENVNGIYDCQGMVQQQIPVQFDVNRLGSNIFNNATTISNPGFDYIADAVDLPPGRITLPPGGGLPINSKYTKRIDDVIRWRDGQQLPMYVYQLFMDKKEAVRHAGGVKPGMIGLKPTGTSHTPEGTIAGIQEASFSRMWSPNDELGACLNDVAMRYLGLIQQYYKPGRYVDLSQGGQQAYVEIQGAHLAAQFRVEVVSGTTTPLHDVEKDAKMAAIKAMVDQSIASGIPEILESTIIYLVNTGYPHAYSWIQLLQRKLQQMQQMQEGYVRMGEMGLRAGLQGQEQMAGPGAPGAEELPEGIRALADESGVPVEELVSMLGQ